VPGPRDYTRSTVMALAYHSGGLCYWPGCPEPVLRHEDGEPCIIVEIAHIHAAFPGGARYDERMTDDQRRRFSNLMLFCDPHHHLVDGREQAYPAKTLRRWKAQREAEPRQALQRLREVTPDGLRKIVADGLKDHDGKLEQALYRLEDRDAEAAVLMRGLIDELAEAYTWQRRRMPDPYVLTEFTSAVGKLAKMGGTLDEFAWAMRYHRAMPRQPPGY
jgi:hypothetical protein